MMLPFLCIQIFLSCLTAGFILKIYHSYIAAKTSEIYPEPLLLTLLLCSAGFTFNDRAKYWSSRIIYNLFGATFAALYHIIWYYEFQEISITAVILISFVLAFIQIIGSTLLLEIISSVRLTYFKGYYLQLVMIHNVFTCLVFIPYSLIFLWD